VRSLDKSWFYDQMDGIVDVTRPLRSLRTGRPCPVNVCCRDVSPIDLGQSIPAQSCRSVQKLLSLPVPKTVVFGPLETEIFVYLD
jgi:hypothetical protein